MIEKMIFNLLAIALFIIIFFIMARRNDTNYVSLLILEAIGIGINFIILNLGIEEPLAVKILEYVLAVILPIAIIIMEKKNINYSEIITVAKVKMYEMFKNDEKARTVLIAFVTKYPNSYIGRKSLAKSYEKQGDYENAMIEYYRTVELKNDDYNSNYKIAEMLNLLGKPSEAEITLNDLLKRKPDCYEASTLLGDMLYSQERFKEAINIYTDALRFRPEDYNLYYNLGMVYIGLNDFQNAKICYDKAAEINSKLYNAYYTLGQLALIANDLDEAERYFTESLYEETEANSYYELSRIYMLKNEREKAITFVQKAFELDIKYLKLAKREPLFITIKQYLIEPEVQNEPEETLSEKELKIKQKLIKTSAIVEKIGIKQREEKIEHKQQEYSDKTKKRNIELKGKE